MRRGEKLKKVGTKTHTKTGEKIPAYKRIRPQHEDWTDGRPPLGVVRSFLRRFDPRHRKNLRDVARKQIDKHYSIKFNWKGAFNG